MNAAGAVDVGEVVGPVGELVPGGAMVVLGLLFGTDVLAAALDAGAAELFDPGGSDEVLGAAPGELGGDHDVLGPPIDVLG